MALARCLASATVSMVHVPLPHAARQWETQQQILPKQNKERLYETFLFHNAVGFLDGDEVQLMPPTSSQFTVFTTQRNEEDLGLNETSTTQGGVVVLTAPPNRTSYEILWSDVVSDAAGNTVLHCNSDCCAQVKFYGAGGFLSDLLVKDAEIEVRLPIQTDGSKEKTRPDWQGRTLEPCLEPIWENACTRPDRPATAAAGGLGGARQYLSSMWRSVWGGARGATILSTIPLMATAGPVGNSSDAREHRRSASTRGLLAARYECGGDAKGPGGPKVTELVLYIKND